MNYTKIKSYEDACKALKENPLSDEVFNAFPKAERANLKAYHQLTVITRAINEGWEPDWTDSEQDKYEPYCCTADAGAACAVTGSAPMGAATGIGSRLCFPDYERAAYAVKTFDALYKAYFFPAKWEDTPAEQEVADGGAERQGLENVPEFLKKVAAVFENEIRPLVYKDMPNRGIIVIAAEETDKTLCASFGIQGRDLLLGKALSRFLRSDKADSVVKRRVLIHEV